MVPNIAVVGGGPPTITMHVTAGGGDTVGPFTFGLYMGTVRTPLSTNRRTGSNETVDSAFVLDSATMKYGWVQLKLLRRVE